MLRSRLAWALLGLLPALGLEAGDLPVSTASGGVVDRVAIAKGPAGDFVAAWEQFGIQTRSFGSSALPAGPVARLDDPALPAIDLGGVSAARFDDGSAIVAWASELNFFPLESIQIGIYECHVDYRLLDSAGLPTGPPVTISNIPGVSPFGCERGSTGVALQPGGSAIVVFRHAGTAGGLVEALRMPAQGNLPPALSSDLGLDPAIASGPAGELAVAWWGYGASMVDDVVRLRLFFPDGTPVGPEFQISDLTGFTNPSPAPDVAYRAGGGWLTVWTSASSAGDDASGTSIQGRFVAADGTLPGPQFQVNTLISGNQSSAHVIGLPDTSFLVTWQSPISGGSDDQGFSIQARRFLADGTPDGPEYQVNSLETGDQLSPDVAADASGTPTFLWTSQGTEVRASDDRTDLGVTITDGTSTTQPGDTLHYLVTVTNGGPADAPGSQVSVPFPASLSCTWTCAGAGGGVCAPGPVSGDIDDVASVPTGGTVDYDAACLVGAEPSGTLLVTATVAAPLGLTDTDLSDNTATDVTGVLGIVIDGVEVEEGNSGTSVAGLAVRLLSPAATSVTVDFATGDGTATAGSDYLPAAGTLSFAPGETLKALDVSVLGDTVFEADETFLVTLSNAVGAPIVEGLAVGTILNDDSALPSGSLDELVHGSSEVRSLESAPGPVAVAQYWGIRQEAGSSYEVIVDGVTGDLGSEGPALERVASDGTIVQRATGTGASRSLRWASDVAEESERIRVQSRGCIDDCDAADVFRVRMWETTGCLPRFNNSASQVTLVLLQDPTPEVVTGRLVFSAADGSELWQEPFSIAPGGTLVLNTASLAALQGQSGAVRVASDAPYGALRGKAVAVEPATGFSFDTPLVYKPR